MTNSIQTIAVITIAIFTTGCGGAGNSSAQNTSASWQEEFGLAERSLSPTGRNAYFVLEPGFQLVLESATVDIGAGD